MPNAEANSNNVFGSGTICVVAAKTTRFLSINENVPASLKAIS